MICLIDVFGFISSLTTTPLRSIRGFIPKIRINTGKQKMILPTIPKPRAKVRVVGSVDNVICAGINP